MFSKIFSNIIPMDKMFELMEKFPLIIPNVVSVLGLSISITDANEFLKLVSLIIVLIINCFVLGNKIYEWRKKRKIKK